MGFKAVTIWNQRKLLRDGQGYWLQPVNRSGVKTSEKTILIRFGCTSVPRTNPSAAPSTEPRTMKTTVNIDASQRQGIEPRMTAPTGSMTAVATMARSVANTTFSAATRLVDIG